VWWGHLAVEAAPAVEPVTFGGQARRAFWYLDLTIIGGAVAGILALGPGGRLAMRLLAVTAGDDAQGRITEAEEVVGDISVDGTLSFMIFIGLGVGLLTAGIYLLLHRWLPSGRLGGLALGALLLVTMAAQVDPLRPDNPDFDIVGPGWLSVATFLALGFFHALVLVAVSARVSRSLPLLRREPRAVASYIPLLLLVPVFTIGVVVVLLLLAAAFLATRPEVRRIWSHPRADVAGRVLILLVALASLPGFVSAVLDIV